MINLAYSLLFRFCSLPLFCPRLHGLKTTLFPSFLATSRVCRKSLNYYYAAILPVNVLILSLPPPLSFSSSFTITFLSLFTERRRIGESENVVTVMKRQSTPDPIDRSSQVFGAAFAGGGAMKVDLDTTRGSPPCHNHNTTQKHLGSRFFYYVH